MTEELKPCPFCDCDMAMKESVNYPSPDGHHEPTCPLIDLDIAATEEEWNTRATLSPAHIEDGEEVEVEVVGYANPADYGSYRFWVCAQQRASVTDPIMTVAQHQRIVASRASKAAACVENEREEFDCWFRREEGLPESADTTNISAAYLPWKAWKARAALSAPPASGVPEGWRELAQQAADALQVFTGHDSGPNLRHRYGENWWEPLNQLRDKLRAMLKATPTPPASEQQQTVPRHKFEGLVEEVRLKDAEIARLAEQVMNLQAYRDGESGDGVWHWQGDGEDHLESLTCPIVIRAQDLRRLVASEQQRAVVIPEREVSRNGCTNLKKGYGGGWNACLDELLRLNPHLAKGEGV